MDKTKEIWKDVPGYEGYYKVSNLGKVKSLERQSWNGFSMIDNRERILKQAKTRNGYVFVGLSKKGKVKQITIHKLVAMCFLNHTPCGLQIVVDHINGIVDDNRLENLQLLSNRDNILKALVNKPHSSKYTGVTFNKQKQKWRSAIRILGYKQVYLGCFKDEYQASIFYLKAFEIKHLYNGNSEEFRQKIKTLTLNKK